MDPPGALVTRADMHGVFVLTDVPEASYYLYARSGNGQAHVRRIGFHDGGPSLAPYGPLDGVPRRAVTDVLGLFRVGPVDARRYRLSAWMPGPRSKSMPIDVTAESIDAGDLRLVPAEGW